MSDDTRKLDAVFRLATLLPSIQNKQSKPETWASFPPKVVTFSVESTFGHDGCNTDFVPRYCRRGTPVTKRSNKARLLDGGSYVFLYGRHSDIQAGYVDLAGPTSPPLMASRSRQS